jgi:hypothetical protein
MEEKKIGFFKLIADDDRKRLIGALLVTDEMGKPEEFRVTYPVKPSVIQRQLYGEALVPHVGIELCGMPLYTALQHKPVLLVVSHLDFLTMSISGSVVHLERAGETIVLTDAAVALRARQQQVQSASGRFAPMRVTYPLEYSAEQRSLASTRVTDFFAGMDLLEPFDRIDVAIRVLQEQDERFR